MVERHCWVKRLVAGRAQVKPWGIEFALDCNGEAVARLPGLHRLHAFLELEEAFAQRIEPRAAFGGQLQPLAGAAKQDNAQMIFERSDLLADGSRGRSEEHTSELQSLMRISYAVFCLKTQKRNKNTKS